jgi:hypothetical protein
MNGLVTPLSAARWKNVCALIDDQASSQLDEYPCVAVEVASLALYAG